MSTMPTTYGGNTTGYVSALGGNMGKCNDCLPSVPFIQSMTDFVAFLDTLRDSIEAYFPADTLNAPIVTDMGLTGRLDVRIFARLKWGNDYRDTYGKFDATSLIHVNLLKDVFISLGCDWTIDTWLREWQPPTDIPA